MATTSTSALQRACQAANGSTRLAQLLTARGRAVSKASVSRWKRERVPAEFCPDIEELTGVKCEELRPDVNWSVLRAQTRKPIATYAQSPEARRKFGSDDDDLTTSIDNSSKG